MHHKKIAGYQRKENFFFPLYSKEIKLSLHVYITKENILKAFIRKDKSTYEVLAIKLTVDFFQ